MHTPAYKPRYARWATASVAALLLGSAVIVPMTVPVVALAEVSSPDTVPGSVSAPAAKCGECGVIESTREIKPHGNHGAHSVPAADGKRYVTLVRMPDGSRRAIHNVNPAAWRAGERVILIAGTVR